MSGIRLDKKHGVNPSLEICYFCGDAKGVVLFGKLHTTLRSSFEKQGQSRDGEAPRSVVMNQEPCSKCIEYMKQGVMLISVDESKTEDENHPYRTGCLAVLKERAISEIFDEETAKTLLEKRAAFVPDQMWDALGLPRGEM